MAISANIVTMGGLTATGAYLRIKDLTVQKIIEGDNNGKWQLVYNVDCYVSADERGSDRPTPLIAPSVGGFKVLTDTVPSDPYAVAYANLKTQSPVSNASDLV